MKKTRLIALIVTLMFLNVVLFSSLFIAHNINHECTGEHCSTCCQISLCEQALKHISLAAASVIISAALIYTALSLLSVWSLCPITTLVTLKVKLSD